MSVLHYAENYFSVRLADWTDRYSPFGYMRCCPINHLDAVYNWTDTEAQSAARTAVSHKGKVGLWVERYGLGRQ